MSEACYSVCDIQQAQGDNSVSRSNQEEQRWSVRAYRRAGNLSSLENVSEVSVLHLVSLPCMGKQVMSSSARGNVALSPHAIEYSVLDNRQKYLVDDFICLSSFFVSCVSQASVAVDGKDMRCSNRG